MKLTVLSENTTQYSTYSPEFGLSLLIETAGQRILYDSGCGDNFLQNAQRLGIDLASVDAAVLSHGHFDHANGFIDFFKVNDHAPLYASLGYDGEHLKLPRVYIGIDRALAGHERVVTVANRMCIGEGAAVMRFAGEPPIHPIDSGDMLVAAGGTVVPDDFSHELYLMVEEGDVRLFVSGCSHKGIGNIMHWAASDSCDAKGAETDGLSRKRITHVIGGFHLISLPTSEYNVLDELADELLSYEATYITCHCTGVEPYARLKQRMGERISYASTGRVIEL